MDVDTGRSVGVLRICTGRAAIHPAAHLRPLALDLRAKGQALPSRPFFVRHVYETITIKKKEYAQDLNAPMPVVLVKLAYILQ